MRDSKRGTAWRGVVCSRRRHVGRLAVTHHSDLLRSLDAPCRLVVVAAILLLAARGAVSMPAECVTGGTVLQHCAGFTGDSLSVASSGITFIQDGAFAGLSSVTSLGIGNQQLSTLGPNTLAGLTSLTSLSMWNVGATLTKLDPDFLQPVCGTLEYINMNDNTGLTAFPDGFFDNCGSLLTISAANTGVQSIGPDTFADTLNLRNLFLHLSRVQEIPARAFEHLSLLNQLKLDHSSLRALRTDVFYGLDSLTKLYIHQCSSFHTIEEGVFDDVPNLELLDMTRLTALTSVPSGAFTGLSSLTTLSLSQFGLLEWPRGLFHGMPALVTLTLSNSAVQRMDREVFSSAGLVSLETLYLDWDGSSEAGYSDIFELPVFDNLPALKDLRLEWLGPLTGGGFTEETFGNLPSLHSLYLDGNPWSFAPIPPLGILDSLSSVVLVRMPSSEIEFIPAGYFDGLTSVVQVYLAGNSFDTDTPSCIVETAIGTGNEYCVLPVAQVSLLDETDGGLAVESTSAADLETISDVAALRFSVQTNPASPLRYEAWSYDCNLYATWGAGSGAPSPAGDGPYGEQLLAGDVCGDDAVATLPTGVVARRDEQFQNGLLGAPGADGSFLPAMGNGARTVSTWVLCSGTSATPVMRFGTINIWQLTLNYDSLPDDLVITAGTSGGEQVTVGTTGDSLLDAWHHVAAAYWPELNRIQFYVDGELKITRAPVGAPFNTDAGAFVGAGSDPPTTRRARFWNIALSAAAVAGEARGVEVFGIPMSLVPLPSGLRLAMRPEIVSNGVLGAWSDRSWSHQAYLTPNCVGNFTSLLRCDWDAVDGDELDLSGLGIESLSPTLATTPIAAVTKLSLNSNTNLGAVNATLLNTWLPNLVDINLRDIGLEAMPDLQELQGLEVVNLADNNIAAFPSPLPLPGSVTKLDLSGNSATTLGADLLAQVPLLQVASFANVPSPVLPLLPASLETLNATSMALVSLPANSFDPAISLQSVALRGNLWEARAAARLDEFADSGPPETAPRWCDPPLSSSLILGERYCAELPAGCEVEVVAGGTVSLTTCCSPTGVDTPSVLRMSARGISAVEEGAFDCERSADIPRVELWGNPVEDLSPSVLAPFAATASSLSLAWTLLTEATLERALAQSAWLALSELDLRGTAVQAIPRAVLSACGAVATLDVSHGAMEALTADDIEMLPRLEDLRVAGTPLSSGLPWEALDGQGLRYLDVSNSSGVSWLPSKIAQPDGLLASLDELRADDGQFPANCVYGTRQAWMPPVDWVQAPTFSEFCSAQPVLASCGPTSISRERDVLVCPALADSGVQQRLVRWEWQLNASDAAVALDSGEADPGAHIALDLNPAIAAGLVSDAGTPLRLSVVGLLDAGELSAPFVVSWEYERVPPGTSLLEKPPRFTRSTEATFVVGCSESGCEFTYSLDGGPRLPLTGGSGNGGDAAALAAAWGLTLLEAPLPVSTAHNATFAFGVYRAVSAELVDVTHVRVVLDGAALPDVAVGEPFHLGDLNDGEHTLVAKGRSADSSLSVVPFTYRWHVSTDAPVAEIFAKPPANSTQVRASFFARCATLCWIQWREVGTSGWNDAPSGAFFTELPEFVDDVPAVRTVEVRGHNPQTGAVGPVTAHTWTTVPSGRPAAPVMLHSSLPGVVEGGSLPRLLPWQTSWFVLGVQSHEAERLLGFRFTLSGSGSPDAVAAAREASVHSRQPAAPSHVVRIPSLPAGEYQLSMHAVDLLTGVQGPPISTSWLVEQPQLSFVEAPSGVTPRSTVAVRFGFTPPGQSVATGIRVEYRVVAGPTASAADAEGYEWNLAPDGADDILLVGPLAETPAGYTLQARWRAEAVGEQLPDLAEFGTVSQSTPAPGSEPVYGDPIETSWTVEAAANSTVLLGGLNDGNHTISVVATDVAGNAEQGLGRFYWWVIDNTVPDTDIDVESLSSGEVTRHTSLGITLYATDGAANAPCDTCTVEVSVTRLGGVVPDELISTHEATSASSIVVDTPFDGTYRVTATSVDAVGLRDPSPAHFEWVVDTVPPGLAASLDVAIVSSPAGYDVVDWLIRTHEVVLLAECSNEVDPCVVTATHDAGGEEQFTIDPDEATQLALSPLADGEYVVHVVAEDAAGNTASLAAPISFLVDTEAATLSVAAPEVPALQNSSVVSLGFTVHDPPIGAVLGGWVWQVPVPACAGGISSVASDANAAGTATAAPHDAGVLPAVQFVGVDFLRTEDDPQPPESVASLVSWERNVEGFETPALSDGAWLIAVATVDMAGNIGDATLASVCTYIDSTPPTSVILHRPPQMTNAVTLSWSLDCGDVDSAGRPCRSVDLLVGCGNNGAGVKYSLEGDGGDLEVSTDELDDGNYTICASARDAAGNLQDGVTDGGWLVLDRSKPALGISVDVEVSVGYTQRESFAVNIDCTDEVSSVCAEVVVSVHTVDGESSAPVWTASLGPLRSGASTQASVGPVDPGIFVLTARAVDGAGNAATEEELPSIQWQRDVEAPTLTLTVAFVAADEIAVEAVASPDTQQIAPGTSASRDQVIVATNGAAAPDNVFANVDGLAVAAECADNSDSLCPMRVHLQLLELPAASGCQAGGNSGQDTGVDADLLEWKAIAGALGVAPLVDGRWSLTLSGVDQASNANNITVEWHQDTVAPGTPQLTTQPALGESLATPSSSLVVNVLITGDTSAMLHLAVWVWSLDGGSDVVEPVSVSDDSSEVSHTLCLGCSGSDLVDGGHTLSVRMRDAAGNEGTTAILTWRIESAQPDTRFFDTPAEESGLDVARFGIEAIDPETGGPLANARFEIHLAGDGVTTDEWVPVCDGTDADSIPVSRPDPVPGNPEVPHSGCAFNVRLPQPEGTYTLKARSVNVVDANDPDPATHVWRVLRCGVGRFGTLNQTNGAIVCADCPAGASCADDGVTLDKLDAQAGWWAADPANLRYYRCKNEAACLPATVSANGSRVPAGCAEGYSGLLCDECAAGFFKQWGECTPCPETRGGAYGVIVGVAFAVVVCAAVLVRYKHLLPIETSKTVVAFAQVSASANSAMSVPWPTSLRDFFDSMKVAMLDLLTLSRASCAAPMSFWDSFGVTMGLFVGASILGVMALACSDARKLRQEREQEQRDREAQAVAVAALQGGRSRRRRRSSIAVAGRQVVDSTISVRHLRWGRVFRSLSMFWLLCYPGVR